MFKELIKKKIKEKVLLEFFKLKLKHENNFNKLTFKETLKKPDENLYDFKDRYVNEIDTFINKVSNESLKILLKKELFLYSLLDSKELSDSFEECFKFLNDDLNLFISRNFYHLEVYISKQEEPFANDWAH